MSSGRGHLFLSINPGLQTLQCLLSRFNILGRLEPTCDETLLIVMNRKLATRKLSLQDMKPWQKGQRGPATVQTSKCFFQRLLSDAAALHRIFSWQAHVLSAVHRAGCGR